MCGCNCHVKKRSGKGGGGEGWSCDSLRRQAGDWAYQEANTALILVIGPLVLILGWIVPSVYGCVKHCLTADWVQEYFRDWNGRGVQVKYLPPDKACYFIHLCEVCKGLTGDGGLWFMLPKVTATATTTAVEA